MTGRPPAAAMVFAAGRGTRMGDLSDSRPKALTPVAGRALIDHALDVVAAAGIPRAVVNTFHLGDQVAAHLRSRPAPRIALSPEAELLDTGGGLKHALPLLDADPIAGISAKTVWRGPNPLTLLAEAWDATRMDALLLVVPRENATGHTREGDFFLDGTRLARRGAAATAPYVYASAQIIAPRALGGFDQPVFSLNPVWDRANAAGRLAALVYPGDWAAIEAPASIAAAEAMLAQPVP